VGAVFYCLSIVNLYLTIYHNLPIINNHNPNRLYIVPNQKPVFLVFLYNDVIVNPSYNNRVRSYESDLFLDY
jgi:hypothetical protein